MIGEDDHGGDLEWMAGPDLAHGAAQAIDVLHEQAAMTFGQVDSEEKNAARVLDAILLT
jgi:hypothetical protein